MASRIKAASAQQDKDAAKINNETVPAINEDLSINAEVKDEAPAEVKTPRKREDPIARAERLLEEARVKAKAAAEKQMDNAVKELELGEKSLSKAVRVYNERRDRVAQLRNMAGVADDYIPNAYTLVAYDFDMEAISKDRVLPGNDEMAESGDEAVGAAAAWREENDAELDAAEAK